MKFRKFVLVASAVVLLPIAPSDAQTRQMDAKDVPEKTGPLERSSTECKTQRERFNGTIVAVGKTCLRIYTFDPGSETDTDRDYGVVWLQSNLDSSHGWCGIKVLSDVNLPADVKVEQRVPPKLISMKRKNRYVAKLRVDARGTTTTPATIAQDAYLYPREIRTSVRLVEAERVFRLKWVGSKDKKLAFPSGAEISWEQGNAPRGISFRLNYALKQKARC